MRKSFLFAGMAALLALAGQSAIAKTPTESKSGSLVIVFKDGHRQTFNLADVDRVEFPAVAVSADAVPANPTAPTRGRYVGKWEVGDGNGNDFFITLKESGEAFRSMGDVHGKWAYVNGEALITWDDGAQDAIRKLGSRFEKSAYSMGKKFTDSPDNVAPATNTSPRPI